MISNWSIIRKASPTQLNLMMESVKSPIKKVKQNEELLSRMLETAKKIAPVWPLESFVAVNPYLGLSDQRFDQAAKYLARVGGIQMTLPISFYKQKLAEGKISRREIEIALARMSTGNTSAEEFISELEGTEDQARKASSISTLIDVASQESAKDWNRFVTVRISSWAASYFDKGQASWSAADQSLGLFEAWKIEAEIDRTPEVTGLADFRKIIKEMPNDALEAANQAICVLDINEQDLNIYLHRILLRLGGWSAYVARIDWDSELYGGKGDQLIEFMAVLLCWESAIYQSLKTAELKAQWDNARKEYQRSAAKKVNEQLHKKLILQEAFDLANQREIIDKFKAVKAKEQRENKKTKAQAIFCIDVRSEVYRRNLENADRHIQTIGFAGFFAFPIKFVPIAHENGATQCPVLIKSGPTIMEEIPSKDLNEDAFSKRILKHQLQRVWKSFKSGAVSCFSFVSPIGLSYLPKLFTDTFGISRPVPHPEEDGLGEAFHRNKIISLEVRETRHGKVGIPPAERLQMAENALRAMSLTEDFAPLVMIVGHGSTTVNNPHATGLDCGACGGRSGESNAKVAAAVLNDPEVREGLKAKNISIPEKTVFLACLHDTTTDEVKIFNEIDVAESRKNELEELKAALKTAGRTSRAERSQRMGIEGDIDKDILARSKDWSQVRPEWGLAGCSSFIVANRERSRGLDFGGRAFLHSYDHQKDKEYTILELIMTAPMVVTSWINLQYYASSVDNQVFGSGNKTLHNVTAGLGVLEGYSGDLRVGLPIQSVHDGEKFQHEPVKLNVMIEAPIEAMNAILEKHPTVKNLVDNRWIHLMAINEDGQVAHKYSGELSWEAI